MSDEIQNNEVDTALEDGTFTNSYESISLDNIEGLDNEMGSESNVNYDSEQTETELESGNTETESVEEVNDFIYTAEDGNEYTQEDVGQWFKDSINKADWNKSNTEKAQEVAEMRKKVEPLVQFIDKIKGNTEGLDTIKQYLTDEYGNETTSVFDALLSGEIEDPRENTISELQSELDSIKGQAVLQDSINMVKSKYNADEESVQRAVDYAVSKMEDDGQFISVEDAFKLLKYDEMNRQEKVSAIKRKPVPPSVVNKTQGAKEISSKKSGTDAYEDIDLDKYNFFG